MLTIDQARAAVLAEVHPLGTEDVAVANALDRALAAPVDARHDVPPFANSAMDGFAVRAGEAGRRLRITGESRAGAPAAVSAGEGEAIRISTGAMLPAGADAVIMVERTTEHDDGSVTLDAPVTVAQNIRAPGGDVRHGQRLLEPGVLLGPAELGVAATAGAATLRCATRPRVAVLATGDELVAPGGPLGPGQIHESNALTLAALATRAGAEVVQVEVVPDDARRTRERIAAALQDADVLLLSGGVSVGPHDHVKPALEACGVREVFWRVALRPGKPTWFGTREAQLVFGLPGNPVSAMVTFLLFARPALAALQGLTPLVPRERAVLAADVTPTAGRDECVRVRILPGGRVEPTGPQESHQLTSMLGADAFAIVPAGEETLRAGTEVDIERLP